MNSIPISTSLSIGVSTNYYSRRQMFKLNDFQAYKQNDKKISMVTAYDYFSAKIVAESGIDTILVGDSLGMVFAGNENTISVTVDDMIYHAKAVKNGAPNSFIIVDMPFLSYHSTLAKTIKNAGKIIKATNCKYFWRF